jgi:hypothetical protein
MRIPLIVSLAGCLSIASACGKKKDDGKTAADAGENPIEKAVKTALADASLAYPQGLGLVLLPEGEAGASLALETPAGPAEGSLAEAQKEDEKFMDGKVDDCLAPIFKQPPAVEAGDQCYEFDQDMIKTEGGTGPQGGNKGTANGLDAAGKQACVVTFAQNKVKQVEDQVDRATGLVQTMLCQAKKSDVAFALPAIGEKKDLATSSKSAFGSHAKSVSSATIERLADLDGKAVYRSRVVMTDERGSARETRLTHSPTGTTKDGIGAFQGSLVSISSTNEGEKKQVLTIRYLRAEKDGKSRLKYDLRMANVHKDVAEAAVGDDGVLDLNHGMDSSNPEKKHAIGGVVQEYNAVFSAIRQISFDIEPSSGEGAFSYWQNPGGNYNEKARGMIFALDRDAAGTLGGCATTGAASTSVRSFLHTDTMAQLAPKGTYHPFLGDDGAWASVTPTTEGNNQVFTKNGIKVFLPKLADPALAKEFAARQNANMVTYQCFVQNSQGFYAIDDAKITEEAGYEVLRTVGNAQDTAKLLPPPVMSEIDALKPLSKIGK